MLPDFIANELYSPYFTMMNRWISTYANNEDLFLEDFKNAYMKLVNLGARWRKSM